MLGWAHLMLDQREPALAALAEAERQRPGSIGGLAMMVRFGGANMLPRGRFPSMAVFEIMQQGLARGREGRLQAMAKLERIAAEQPQPPAFHYLWGLLHLVSVGGDPTELERSCARFDKVLELDPTHAWSHAACARGMIQAGKLEPALGRMDRALALAPNDPLMHAMYGEVLLHGRQVQAAVTRLQDAERAFPDNPIVSAYLAQALAAAGDRAAAEAAARRAEAKARQN